MFAGKGVAQTEFFKSVSWYHVFIIKNIVNIAICLFLLKEIVQSDNLKLAIITT